MFDNIILELFIYYALQNNKFKILNNLRLLCNECNNSIKNDIYFNRKKNGYLLNNILNNININYYPIDVFIQNKDHLKYIFNNIYNIYISTDFMSNNYKKNIVFYKYDKLNPLKNLPIFKKSQIKQRMKQSIYLNMALDHADKEVNIDLYC